MVGSLKQPDSEYLLHFVTISASCLGTLLIAAKISLQISKKWIPIYYNNMKEEDKWTWRGTFASIVNAIIAAAWAAHILLTEDLQSNVFWHNSLSTRLLSSFEIGYFLADSLWLCLCDTQNIKMEYLFHHMFGIVGLGMTVVCKTFAFHTCLRVVSDFSTPFMHTRWALRAMNLHTTRIYYINGLVFVLTYFVGRICPMPLYYAAILRGVASPDFPTMPLFCKIVFFGTTALLDTLNVYWFFLILKGCWKLVTSKERTD